MLAGMMLAAGLALLLSGPGQATELDTGIAEQRLLPREYRLDGVVEAVNRTTVSAQTRGQVQEILFDIDDYVTQGTVIIRLKDTEQQAQLSQAEADLKAAGARYQEALDDYRRIRGVFEKDLVSQAEMDSASNALQEAQARRDASAAQLQQASEQFEYTQVRAPYSGIVTDRHVEVGETAHPGQKLMSGISLEQLRVTVDVPQSLIPAIRRIDKAGIQLPAGGWIEAVDLTIFPYAHHSSNTFKVRLELPQGIEDLFPGMFVKANFIIGEREELLIPRSAVVYRSEVTGVYVIGPDGRISLRHIRLGHNIDDQSVVVLAGLDAGERVALDPIAAATRLKQQRRVTDHE